MRRSRWEGLVALALGVALAADAGAVRPAPVAKTGVEDARWSPLGGDLGCNAQVNAVATAPDGTVYFGGQFTSCGGVAASRIARFDPVSRAWSSVGAGPDQGVDGVVFDLAIGGGSVYVAGNFARAGGLAAQRVARYELDSGRWFSLGVGTENGVTGPGTAALAIAVDGAQIYVGGELTAAGGRPAQRIARFDSTRGVWFALGGSSDGVAGSPQVVLDIAAADGVAYVAGGFSTAGGQPARNIARYVLAGDAWFPLAAGPDNGVGGISNIATTALIVGGEVYVGGDFASAGGIAANHIARYDAGLDAWFPLLGGGGANGTDGNVDALALTGTTLYVGGNFGQAGGATAAYAARFDTETEAWSPLTTDPALSVGNAIVTLTLSGSELFAGGGFLDAGGSPANRVAGFDTSSGSRWDPLDPQSNGFTFGLGGPNRLAADADHVVACGGFAAVGGMPADGLAVFDRSTGLWAPIANTLGSACQAIALAGSSVFVGGFFNEGSGAPANGIARYDLDTGLWSPLGVGTSAAVRAIEIRGDDLYVGGSFTFAGGVSAPRIARYDLGDGTWASLDGAGGGTNDEVHAIALVPGEVLLGGVFTQAGGGPANRIARFVEATSTWSSLGDGTSNGVGAGTVHAITALDDDIYAGGTFLQAGGVNANRIARFDRGSATWAALGAGSANGTSSLVAALVNDGRYVYAGGDFLSVHGQAINGVARWDPSAQAWSSLASGLQTGSGVTHLALDGTMLFVGGSFTTAGGRTANLIATWDTRAAVATTLSSSATSLAPRTSVTLTATVTVGSFPAIPGVVAFLDGSAVLSGCDAVALGGAGSTRTAQCTTNVLTAGSHRLHARYTGDSDNASDTSLALAVDVVAPEIAVLPANLADARLGTSYSATVTASGGDGALEPFALEVVAGSLPPGLALQSATGLLSGTPTGVRGTASFSIGAHDASTSEVGGPFAGRREYSLTVLGLATGTSLASSANPQLVNTPLTLTATVIGADPSGTVAFRDGIADIAGCEAVPLAGSGGTKTAQCTTSALAVGQRSLTAAYSGDPTHEPGTSAPFSQTIEAPVIVLEPATLPGAFVGVSYSQQVTASGDGAQTPFGFDNGGFEGAPALPPGLTLSGSSGQITGTPQQTGTYDFTIRAVDASPASVGGPFVGQRDYTIGVQLQPTVTTIASIVPSPATQAEAYEVTVEVAGMVGAPGGTVAISDGIGASCFVTLASGSGSCQMATGTVGERTITASYGGLPPHAPSAGSTTLQVDPSSNASASRITIGARVGVRGQTLPIPVAFRGDGTTVGFTAQVNFDKDRLQFVSAQPIGDVLCNRLGSPLDDRIRVQAPGTPTGQPLSPNVDTRYCELTFRVADSAPGGVYPLGIVTSTCEDGNGILRVCTTTNGSISVSAVETSLPDLSLLAISGYTSDVDASRSVRITNRGDVPLAVDCTVFGPTAYSLVSADPLSIGPQLDALVVVGCTLPALGTTLTGQLVCTTNDAARPTLQYGLTCQRVPDGTPLPGDQIFDDGLKQGDQLGTSAGVSRGDAGVMAVGAPFAGADARGRVLIYEGEIPGFLVPVARDDGGLLRKARAPRAAAMLAPPRARAKGAGSIGDKFGQAVAVSRDGTRVAVGSPVGGASGAGEVLVYARPSGGWQDANLAEPIATIAAPFLPGASVAEFGASLTFLPDGDLAIGAPGTASGVGGVGAAFVFDAGTGSDYSRTETLTSTSPQGQGRFGAALDVSLDGTGSGHLVVGAPQEGALGQQSGRAYVYPMANGAIGLPQPLVSSQPALGDKWGSSVAVRDGVVVIGAVGDDTPAGVDSGSASVFRARPDGSGLDLLTMLLPASGATQGAGAAVATNGDIIVLGAPLTTVAGRVGQGRVYVYDVEVAYAASVPPRQTIENNDGRVGDDFGRALAINARGVLAGVPLDDRELDANTALEDVGRADPFVLDRFLRNGFE